MKVVYARIAFNNYGRLRRRKERTPMVWKENRENAYCEITPAILALKEQWEKKEKRKAGFC